MKETVYYSEPGPDADSATLFILDRTGEIRKLTLADYARIGRDTPENDVEIPIHSAITSRKHGEFTRLPAGYRYRDLNSLNGTFINGKRYGKDGQAACMLQNGDVLRIDQSDLKKHHADSVLMLFFTGDADGGWHTQALDEKTGDIRIGRQVSRQEGLRFADQAISRKHATFVRGVRGWSIVDHESKNGVYLNNERINHPMPLYPLDVVRIAGTTFLFLGDRLLYNAEESAGSRLTISIKERSVRQLLKKRVLLEDINLTVDPGEMVLILGGSGAGKTTFMNAVMGYEKADGRIWFGDMDVYKDFDQMKYRIGFVPQKDTVRAEDSVIGTLDNAARMKMPAGTTAGQRAARIEEVLSMLGLGTERNSLVKKLSGGQIKRLSIAIEFIADPSLFFLDEPDSGLDGIMALSLMENLRVIADEGKIVMVITHGPDRVAELFDKVVVLAKSARTQSGQLAYFGSLPDALAFFETDSLEGIVRRINRPDEGGDGMADHYITRYRKIKGEE